MSTTNSKWLPPQQEGFGPWIEFTGTSRPVSPNTEVLYLTAKGRRNQRRTFYKMRARAYAWSDRCVAYCVKLEGPRVQHSDPVLASAPTPQPAPTPTPASGLTRLVALRKKALHTLEETTISDPQVAFWGVSIDGVPMVRLPTLADAQLVERLADAAFQAGRQKAFSDLLGFVEGQR